ncbi:MAG: ABC transporter permease subunit [Sinobacteraceae bacterium]|nr:ABC transporter permease subunit [Nevskiaceae bacterium]MCP5359352.1 ABC transporter permease subunit [Nevskiaceae bacterium]MCP5470789.1 ABC transporter permease subunit [Nevskiaceae bacterium]
MNALIVAHEGRLLARSGALWAVLGLLALALGFAAWSGGRNVERQLRGANDAIAYEDGERARMRRDTEIYAAQVAASGGAYEFAMVRHSPGKGPPQGTNAGAVGAETSAYVALPPTGLAALAIGQSDVQLNYLPVQMGTTLEMIKQVEIENPVNLQTGPLDVAFVIIFLLPIFILAMTYDLLSSEKERGTLAMILAHPVSLRELLASKIAARAVAVLVVVIGFGFAALLTVGSQLDQAETWWRFAAWIVATLLYATFWFAVAVLVNLRGRSSATNGTILAGIWLMLVVIVPNLVSLVATTAFPAPSRMDLIVAARDAQTEAENSMGQALDRFYSEHTDHIPVGDQRAMDFLTLAQANAASIEKALLPLYQRFRDQILLQEGLVQRFQYLSPAIMMQSALNEVSGTSTGRYQDFVEQATRFRYEWNGWFAERFLRREPLRPADYDLFPKFQYRPEPTATVWARLWPSLLGLLVVCLGVVSAPMVGMRRLEVAAR